MPGLARRHLRPVVRRKFDFSFRHPRSPVSGLKVPHRPRCNASRGLTYPVNVYYHKLPPPPWASWHIGPHDPPRPIREGAARTCVARTRAHHATSRPAESGRQMHYVSHNPATTYNFRETAGKLQSESGHLALSSLSRTILDRHSPEELTTCPVHLWRSSPLGLQFCAARLGVARQPCRSQYTALSLLGTYYGGNGTTTFACPICGRGPMKYGQYVDGRST